MHFQRFVWETFKHIFSKSKYLETLGEKSSLPNSIELIVYPSLPTSSKKLPSPSWFELSLSWWHLTHLCDAYGNALLGIRIADKLLDGIPSDFGGSHCDLLEWEKSSPRGFGVPCEKSVFCRKKRLKTCDQLFKNIIMINAFEANICDKNLDLHKMLGKNIFSPIV